MVIVRLWLGVCGYVLLFCLRVSYALASLLVAYVMVVGVRHCGIVALILSLLLVCLDLR